MVFVVDDHQSVREALSSLIRSIGLDVETYASAHEYLRRPPPQSPACLVLDVRMPGLSGLDLQRELAHQGRENPNHIYHSSRGHSDDGQSHEGWCGRIPIQTVS
jgi:FixJ family two-component response regulator